MFISQLGYIHQCNIWIGCEAGYIIAYIPAKCSDIGCLYSTIKHSDRLPASAILFL